VTIRPAGNVIPPVANTGSAEDIPDIQRDLDNLFDGLDADIA